MSIPLHFVLKWLHILAMVYWLGGEWGIFQISSHIVNPRIPLAERKRHLDTAYRIDILARMGIVLLLPLGIHMGYTLGAHPFEWLIAPSWIVFLAWECLMLSAFFYRGTPRGLALTRFDDRLRYVLIPALFGVAAWSLFTGGPLTQKWYAAKILIFSLLLVVGLLLRYIMRHWTTIMIELDRNGPNEKLEAQLERENRAGHKLAYCYWVGIATVAFLGVTKPF